MTFATYYPTRTAALAALAEQVVATRVGWGARLMCFEGGRSVEHASPCHRRSPAEAARWAQADAVGTAPLQIPEGVTAVDVASVEVAGEFARYGERHAGKDRKVLKVCWPSEA